MGKINLCFVLSSDSSQINVKDNFSANYQLIYKPIVSFLYANPELKFTFSFTGPQLVWYKKNYPEFLKVLGELTARKQVELLGGGFYNPIFPLLYPSDRAGQIEMLSSEIRRATGKRPRGLSLCASSWDPSLIFGFQTCGMEYVILDSSLVPDSKQYYLPIISADKGKTLCVLPSFREFSPQKEIPVSEYIKNLISSVKERGLSYSENNDYEQIVTVFIGKHQLAELLNSSWLKDFLAELKNNFKDSVELSLPLTCRRSAKTFVQAYIPAGISSDIALWASKPFSSVSATGTFPVTIYDFFRTYPRQEALYNRMLYLSLLLNQCHGDKMRKKAARDKLWEAQTGEAYICTPNGVVADSKRRLVAYKSLAEAEKLLREADEFTESITAFDYNCDGVDEYLCRMNHFNACIGLKSGSIFEFDVMKNCGNYADNFKRLEKFDGYTDRYCRGFFVDSLFDEEEFEAFKNLRTTDSGIFTNKNYSLSVFNSKRHEIKFEAEGNFSTLRQPVRLRKNYVITGNGLMVQYILKNESPFSMSGKLTVESNFSRPDDKMKYLLEAVSNGERNRLDSDVKEPEMIEKVSFVQIVDSKDDITFIFEPNENASFIFSQISFQRPDKNGKTVVAGRTLVTSFCWDVQLAAGMEMEKTINFTIVAAKHKKN